MLPAVLLAVVKTKNKNETVGAVAVVVDVACCFSGCVSSEWYGPAWCSAAKKKTH